MGHALGVCCAVVALLLGSVALVGLLGWWGFVAAAGLWAAPAVILVDRSELEHYG